ncbi:MAG: hypothetical protein LBQ12_15260 [Deltaproteobacteria bacterium]|jgi:hypothetical protein|nr:hypothetical protein [Deltaproteobacteria bacterium]
MDMRLKERLKAGAMAIAVAACIAAVPTVHAVAARADQSVSAAKDKYQAGDNSEVSLREGASVLHPAAVLDPRFREVPKTAAEGPRSLGGGGADDAGPALIEMARAGKLQSRSVAGPGKPFADAPAPAEQGGVPSRSPDAPKSGAQADSRP